MSFPSNFIEILKLHEKCSKSLLAEASRLSPNDIEFTTDPFRIRVRKMVNSVLAENHMMKAFVRLKPRGEKVLFGYMRPQHGIWKMTATFFAKRFPGTIIVLGNNKMSWVSFFDGEEMRFSQGQSLTQTLELIDSQSGSTESGSADMLWNTYYWSQYRPEAKNTVYFRHNMPEKYTREAGIRAETDSGGTTLDDFLDK